MMLAALAYFAFRSGNFSSPVDWLMGELYVLPAIIIGLSFHEFGHAVVAYKLGDNTPKLQGRVTVNPLAHVDPIGLICLIFAGFGWGRPVEINPANFKHRRSYDLLVAVAGAVMNLLLAIIFAFVLKFYLQALGYSGLSDFQIAIELIIYYVIYINLVLMVFNLLPIPPLDGFNIIVDIFNLRNTAFYRFVYDKGIFIILILVLFNFTGYILRPCINFFLGILGDMIGIGLVL